MKAYLLDTHAFIWWVNEPEKLTSTIIGLMQNPETDIFLSMASVWEIQIKYQLGKLNLALPLPEILDAQQQNNIQLLQIDLTHIYTLGKLPQHHRDPFDRLLIAQAIAENMTFITHDSKITQYEVKILW